MRQGDDDARKRVRGIREQALARLAERDQSAATSRLIAEISDLKSMVAAQQEQIAALTAMVAALSCRLSSDDNTLASRSSTPRPLSPEKRMVLERIQELRTQNMSFSSILEIFMAENVPTLSGQGQWSKGTLWNLWKNHGHQLTSR